MNFNKNQIWSSFDHWVTRSIRPKLINLKSSMFNKSKMRFTLHFPSWALESHSFGLKYGHFRHHQLQKCPNSKNYFVKAHWKLYNFFKFNLNNVLKFPLQKLWKIYWRMDKCKWIGPNRTSWNYTIQLRCCIFCTWWQSGLSWKYYSITKKG